MERNSPLDFVRRTPDATMRLLIIEDDRDAVDYLVKAFREVGHVADSAADGDQSAALLPRSTPASSAGNGQAEEARPAD